MQEEIPRYIILIDLVIATSRFEARSTRAVEGGGAGKINATEALKTSSTNTIFNIELALEKHGGVLSN